MFAVDHAATALLIRRRFPSVSLVPLLVSVQVMELAWVALNYLGIEHIRTAAAVRTVADIHLTYMPYSHSVLTAFAAAAVAWGLLNATSGRRSLGLAVALGIVSHLVLDLLTHAADIALWPGAPFPKLGLGLYGSAPWAAFAIELSYGVLCWWIYRGNLVLLSVLVAGNLANVSFFLAGIRGPEQFLAGHPMLVVTAVCAQIITTLVLVGLCASRPSAPARARDGFVRAGALDADTWRIRSLQSE